MLKLLIFFLQALAAVAAATAAKTAAVTNNPQAQR